MDQLSQTKNRRMRYLWVSTLLLILALPTVGHCFGRSKPKPIPSPSPSWTPVPSPTVTPTPTPTPTPTGTGKAKIPLSGRDPYLVYYGSWDRAKILLAQRFKLVILSMSAITSSQIRELRAGRDGVLGTSDDVMALGYLSVGEEHGGRSSLTRGDGKGPVRFEDGRIVELKRGIASWYMDADGDGKADRNGEFGSYYVNAGDPAWQAAKLEDAAEILKDADGLFLDTVDTASPSDSWAWTNKGMSTLVKRLHESFPQNPIVVNRGLHYFNPNSSAYANTIRPYVSGVMFENYYSSWDYSKSRGVKSPYWLSHSREYAPALQAEASKPDGFKVLVLDYMSREQSDFLSFLAAQRLEVARYPDWSNSISEIELESIWFDLFK